MIKYVVEYDNSLPLDEISAFADRVNTTFPDDNVLFIPQNFMFKSFSLEDMIEVRDQMTRIIEEESRKAED